MWRRALIGGAAATASIAGGTFVYFEYDSNTRWHKKLLQVCKADLVKFNQRPTTQIPGRQEMISQMETNDEYDLLVIGGGVTGAGVMLDAQTRGLKTALVEFDDFSSGTSSRSTKLIHGGVRYLQAAIMKLDIEQYRMVKEALHERANLLEIAPHLAYPLPIMLPVYKWWQLPYFYTGIKMYDIVSGKRVLKSSYVINKRNTLELFPMLKKDKLVGAIIYYDGQHDDSRMNIAIVLTAIRHGAHAINHAQVTDLIKDETGNVKGAWIEDRLSGKKWRVRAKSVVNATGPYMDTIRKMDNPEARELCIPSVGTHIVLPAYYSPANTGLLDPATTDGRVVFFLPWQKMTVAGTTDSPSPITHSPAPSEKDINFILEEIKHYLSPEINVRRGDVMSAWAGLRPLVRDPKKADTKSLARNHIIEVSDSKLISVGGGKWTTYRQMAEDVVSTVLKENPDIKPIRDCVTTGLLLEGAHEWHSLMYIRLVQDFGIEEEVSHHLASTYGDRATSVANLCKPTSKRWPLAGTRLHQEYPYLEAEIRYGCRRELAATAVDVIARRLRLAFLNTHAAIEALPRVVEIMAEELKWSRAEKERQLKEAMQFIDVEMGQSARSKAIMESAINLTHEEAKIAKRKFHQIDIKGNGIITLNDLRRHFKDRGEKLDERTLHELLNEIDLDKNGEVNLVEWLQLYSGIKGGQISQNRLAKYLSDEDTTDSGKISVNRSGGGV